MAGSKICIRLQCSDADAVVQNFPFYDQTEAAKKHKLIRESCYQKFSCSRMKSYGVQRGHCWKIRDYFMKTVTFVYSMNSNSWRKIRTLKNFFVWDMFGTGVFSNGSLYWVAIELHQENRNGVIGNSKIVYCMIVLDLTTETFRKVPLPRLFAHSEVQDCILQLDVLGDRLFLSCSYRKAVGFHLWMTTDFSSENTWIWILSSGDICSNTGDDGPIRPVAYLKNKEQILLQLCNEKFLWCDVKYKSLKSVRILGLPKNFSSQVFPASLVRLKGNDSAYPEGIASEGTLKRKRNKLYDDRLKLKIISRCTVIPDLSWTAW